MSRLPTLDIHWSSGAAADGTIAFEKISALVFCYSGFASLAARLT